MTQPTDNAKPMTDAEIQRYELIETQAGNYMHKEPDGEWVKHSDYAETIRQRDAEIERLKERIQELEYQND